MSRFLLDTDICIHLMKGEHDLDQKIAVIGLQNCFISEITIAELTYGVENSSPKYKAGHVEALQKLQKAFQGRVVSINDCFTQYAKEKVRLKNAGTPIGEFDLLIGCSALALGLTMVTKNTREFSRIADLTVENCVE